MLLEILKPLRQYTFFLTFLLFIVSTAISVVLPWKTKISKFIGIPFRFYGEGVFPWLGDLEDKKAFFIGGLFLNIFFWFLVSSIILLLYHAAKSRK